MKHSIIFYLFLFILSLSIIGCDKDDENCPTCKICDCEQKENPDDNDPPIVDPQTSTYTIEIFVKVEGLNVYPIELPIRFYLFNEDDQEYDSFSENLSYSDGIGNKAFIRRDISTENLKSIKIEHDISWEENVTYSGEVKIWDNVNNTLLDSEIYPNFVDLYYSYTFN